jgi:hypothetical protein
MKIVLSVSTSAYEPKAPPAKVAREMLASRADLAQQPFGRLVSKIARGQEIPEPPAPPEVVPPASKPVEPPINTVDITV